MLMHQHMNTSNAQSKKHQNDINAHRNYFREALNIIYSTNSENETPLTDIPIEQKNHVSRDGVKMRFENFSKTCCSSLDDLSRDGVNPLRVYISETIYDSDTEGDE